MKFNINFDVRVKLTDLGRTIHKKNHEDLFAPYGSKFPYTPPIETLDGWSTWKLWDLMHEFGKHVYNGCKPPFETEIDIPENQVP